MNGLLGIKISIKWGSEIYFLDPEKGSGKSFLVKMANFGHFHALQKYTCLWCFLFPYKIEGKSIPNYAFLTQENGPKSHFSSRNSLFFGVLTHLKNSLPDIFWRNFLLPIKVGGEDYGRKKIHEEKASGSMFFWPVKMVRKFNFLVENRIFCIFTNFKNALPDICLGIFLLPIKIGCEWITRNKNRDKIRFRNMFFGPRKRGPESHFHWKWPILVIFTHYKITLVYGVSCFPTK